MKRLFEKRNIALIVVLVITIMSLTACGESTNKTVTTTSSEEGAAIAEAVDTKPNEIGGTIEVGGWPSGDDAFEAALIGFNEMYPNLPVELVFPYPTSHHQSLQTAFTAGLVAPSVSLVVVS